jgi:glycine/D-amino acid oxidase-like deaminating enzyme
LLILACLVGVDDVAIIAGGLAGLTLAIGLVCRHFQVSVYEQFPTFVPMGTTLGIAPNWWKTPCEKHSLALMNQWHVWGHPLAVS